MTHPRGERIGKYVVRRKLAEGGMAEIFLCTLAGPEGFAKDVVVKRIRPQFGADALFLQRFIAEARLASLLNHPNVVQIFDFGKSEDGAFYLAMEYVRGCSLWELKRHCQVLTGEARRVPLMLTARIGADVARGLHSAHRLSENGRALELVHRDVSPHNVLLSRDGAVKLADFGVARAATHAMTASGMLVGKFAYMSPEQARGEPIDARTDVFALGIVLWELVAGARLFEADSDVGILRAVQERMITPPRRLDDSVPAELDAAIMRALERDPGKRFQTAQELERALSECLFKNVKAMEETDLAAYLEQILGGEDTTTDVAEGGPPEETPEEGAQGSGAGGSVEVALEESGFQQTLIQRPAGLGASRVSTAMMPRPEESRGKEGLPGEVSGAAHAAARGNAVLPPPDADEDPDGRTAVLGRDTSAPLPLLFVAERQPGEPLAHVATQALNALPAPLLRRPRPRVVALAGGVLAAAALVAAGLGLQRGGATEEHAPSSDVTAPSRPPGSSKGNPRLALEAAHVTGSAREERAEQSPVPPLDKGERAYVEAAGSGGDEPAGPVGADAAAPQQARVVSAGGTGTQAERVVAAAAEPAATRDAGSSELALGEVLLRVTPWAMVFVDGRALGEVTGRRALQLPPGRHRLRFEHPRKTFEKIVEVRDGRRTSFEFNALKKP